MSLEKRAISKLLLLLLFSGAPFSVCKGKSLDLASLQLEAANRTVQAFIYPRGEKILIGMVGTFLSPRASGIAEVERHEHQTAIKMEVANLIYPQILGTFYTTYILWAVRPDGKVVHLADIPISNNFEIEVATPYQAFGLIITAEPHTEVRLPSPIILVENEPNRKTSGVVGMFQVGYQGDDGFLYLGPLPGSESSALDAQAPMPVLGARRAVEIARRAGAREYAKAELERAEMKLAELEKTWPQRKGNVREYTSTAREIMRLAEQARSAAAERRWKQGVG
jgi:Domain of unknown function (DUF4398)